MDWKRSILFSRPLLVLLALGGCTREAAVPRGDVTPSHSPAPTDLSSWTSEDIARDPDGYMQWADGHIAAQLDDRSVKLLKLSERRDELRMRQRPFAANLEEIQNLHNRFVTVCRRADDEGRWPVHIAGHAFEQIKARAIIEHTRKYIEDRKPIGQAYDRLIARLDETHDVLDKEIKDLGQLRERLALDLERVRLDRGNEELRRLRQTGAEIEGLARTLTGQVDDPLSARSLARDIRQPAGTINVEEFLK